METLANNNNKGMIGRYAFFHGNESELEQKLNCIIRNSNNKHVKIHQEIVYVYHFTNVPDIIIYKQVLSKEYIRPEVLKALNIESDPKYIKIRVPRKPNLELVK